MTTIKSIKIFDVTLSIVAPNFGFLKASLMSESCDTAIVFLNVFDVLEKLLLQQIFNI